MDINVSDENILGHITEFKEIHDEYNVIMNEIREYKKKYENRLKDLKSQMEKKEKIIMEYMKINNHPGLNYKGILITRMTIQQGKRISNKKKQEQMNSILNKYQITPSNPLYNDLKKMIDAGTQKEKLKFKS